MEDKSRQDVAAFTLPLPSTFNMATFAFTQSVASCANLKSVRGKAPQARLFAEMLRILFAPIKPNTRGIDHNSYHLFVEAANEAETTLFSSLRDACKLDALRSLLPTNSKKSAKVCLVAKNSVFILSKLLLGTGTGFGAL